MAERTETDPRTPEQAPTPGPARGDQAPAGARVRSRLARIGGRSTPQNPVLDPLLAVYRQTHPKGDV